MSNPVEGRYSSMWATEEEYLEFCKRRIELSKKEPIVNELPTVGFCGFKTKEEYDESCRRRIEAANEFSKNKSSCSSDDNFIREFEKKERYLRRFARACAFSLKKNMIGCHKSAAVGRYELFRRSDGLSWSGDDVDEALGWISENGKPKSGI